ncbi:MAG: 6-bladed beta-propeller [Bacteroidaceae bacterium]
MRRLHLVVYSIILLLTFCSCQQEGGQEGMEFDCTAPNVDDWGKYLHIEECIPLESPDSLGLGDAYKCVFGNGWMVYWDYSRKSLYSYTTDGRFLGKIGAEGRSESEYIGIKDIFMDKDGEQLYVLDELGILSYDMETGEFVSREKPELPDFYDYCKIAVLDPKHYLLFNPQPHGLGTVIDYHNGEWKDLRKAGFCQHVCARFYYLGHLLRVISDYGEFFIDTYRDGGLSRAVTFKFSNPLPGEMKPRSFRELVKVSDEGKWFKRIRDACETKRWVYAIVEGPEQEYYWVFGDKKTGKALSGIKHLEDGLQVVGGDEECFYGILYPEMVSDKSFMKDWVKASHSEEEPQPMLVKFRVKDED